MTIKIEPHYITLQGGRKLAYHEFGDPAGRPVINCHGGLVSGLDIMWADIAAKKAGVRVISPDRPGIGKSDDQSKRTLLDWSSDVAELATHLEIKKFAVMGWSMGGQYAAACAYSLPNRVTHLTLIAGCLELSHRKQFKQLNPLDRRFSRLSHKLPWLAEAIYGTTYLFAKLAPKAFTKTSVKKLTITDQRIIMSEPIQNFVLPAKQALAHPKGLVEEYRVFVEPWGFSLDEVKTRTDIWQGNKDTFVPPDWAEVMQKAIPNSNLHMVASAGHFVAHTEIENILKKIIKSENS